MHDGAITCLLCWSEAPGITLKVCSFTTPNHCSGPRVTRSVEESLERLHTSYIDLIQVHDMEFGSLDQVTPDQERKG